MSDFLERYKPGLAIQQGTIGQAFTAIDRQRNRPVIIKQIGCAGKEAAAAVLQEWARLLLLRHPLLVPVFETDLDELDFYLAIQYIEGNSLRRLLSSLTERVEEQRGLERVLWSARALLDGLQVLHSAGVAHGDLCPENIWFNEQAILLDSGLARLARLASIPEDPRLKSALSAIPIGSPAYRAPELASGAMPELTSDMYSLGVILHESLTGRRPGANGPELSDTLSGNEALTNLITSLISVNPTHRPDVQTTLDTLDQLARTPSSLKQRAASHRSPSVSPRLEAKEAEVYQARATLLLETDPLQRAQLHRSIAAHLARRMNHNEALEECQAGHADAAGIKDIQARAKVETNLIAVEMQICFNRARFEEMLSLGQKALGLLIQAGLVQESTSEAAKIYLKLARFYYRRGKQTELAEALERARYIAHETNYEAGLAEADIIEAQNLGWTKGQLDEGIVVAQRALETARRLDVSWLQSESLRIIGGCYQYKNDLPGAMTHYQQALEVAEQGELSDLMAAALYNLGLICEVEGDFANCESYFLRSLEVARRANVPRPQAIAYKGLNLLYSQLGRLPEAYEQARLHLRLIQEISDQQLLPDANYQMGWVCLELGRLEESEYFISTGRELGAAIGGDLILIELERLAASLRLKQGRLNEAQELVAVSRRRAGNQLGESLLMIDRVQLEIDLARLDSRDTPALLSSEFHPAQPLEVFERLVQRSERLLEQVREVKPSFEASFLALHGRILAIAGNWSDAEAAFKQAIQKADERKQRLSLALALEYYGCSLLEKLQKDSYGKPGQRGRAIGLLANAKAVYTECSSKLGLARVNQLLQQIHGSSSPNLI